AHIVGGNVADPVDPKSEKDPVWTDLLERNGAFPGAENIDDAERERTYEAKRLREVRKAKGQDQNHDRKQEDEVRIRHEDQSQNVTYPQRSHSTEGRGDPGVLVITG